MRITQFILLILFLPLSFAACSKASRLVAEEEGGSGARLEQRSSSGWRTAVYSVYLLHEGDEFMLTRDWERARGEGFLLASDPEGRRFQWFDGANWQIVYRVETAPGVISDPRLLPERREWSDVEPLLKAAAAWITTLKSVKKDRSLNAVLQEVGRYPAAEQREFLLFSARIPKLDHAQKQWMKLAKGLPSPQREELFKGLVERAEGALAPDQPLEDFVVLSLVQLSQDAASQPEVFVKLLKNSRVRKELRESTYIALLRAVAQKDMAAAAKEACGWFSEATGKGAPKRSRHWVLPLIALAKIECEAAAAYAAGLGYCCSKDCLPESLYRSSEDLWSGRVETLTGRQERNIIMLSYLRDTGKFPHLPEYHRAYARLDYTQSAVGVGCLNRPKADLPCDCELEIMQSRSCRAPIETDFELEDGNCKFKVNDDSRTFESVVSMASRATRVFVEPLYGGLVCKYENPPFAKSTANYRWFANGSPFTQVMHGDPSLPAGLGRGSLPEADRITPREIPEDIPFDATFVCEVRFTNQKGALKRLLKLKKNNPPQVFKSEPAPLAGRAAPAP